MRNFRGLFVAGAGANLGDGLVVTVFPLLVLTFTDAPALVAGVTLAHTLPHALFPLLAGVLADRTDRRRLIAWANGVRVAAALSLVVAFTTHAHVLVVLYVVAFLIGAGETVADIAAVAILPSLVGKSRLTVANAWLQASASTLNEFVGPPLGAALLSIGAGVALGGVAGAYLVAAGGVLLVRGRHRPVRPASSARSDLAGALRFVWRNRTLRDLNLTVGVMAAAWSAWIAVLVLYVVRPGPVGLTPVGYGLLLTTLAAGGVAGSVLAPFIQRQVTVRWILAGNVLASVILLGVPALTANPVAIALAVFTGGFGSGLWNVVVPTLKQRITPEEMLGRVAGVGRLIGWGGLPIGAGLAGVLAQSAGPRAVFATSAAATLAMMVPIVRIGRDPMWRRDDDRTDTEGAEAPERRRGASAMDPRPSAPG